jgi:hypothetical protein
MSASTKAEELISKMIATGIPRSEAINCALVSAEEVLKATAKPKLDGVTFIGMKLDDYWLEIRDQLDKLKQEEDIYTKQIS